MPGDPRELQSIESERHIQATKSRAVSVNKKRFPQKFWAPLLEHRYRGSEYVGVGQTRENHWARYHSEGFKRSLQVRTPNQHAGGTLDPGWNWTLIRSSSGKSNPPQWSQRGTPYLQNLEGRGVHLFRRSTLKQRREAASPDSRGHKANAVGCPAIPKTEQTRTALP